MEVWLSSDLTHAEELKRTPLDAAVPCPECSGESWDRVEWREDDPEAPTARVRGVACRSCGHIDFAYPLGRRRRHDQARAAECAAPPDEPSAADILEEASFPIYVPARPELPRLALGRRGWGSESGRLEGVILIAGDRDTGVEVGSSTDRLRLTAADRARKHLFWKLRSSLPDRFDRDRDVAILKRQAAMRPLQAAAAAARARDLVVPVEGGAVTFALVEHAGRWAAATEGIVVAGRNVAPEDVALRLLRPDDELASACGP